MKITICGSIAFYNKMLEIKEQLEGLGYEVDLPPSKIKDGQGKIITVTEYYDLRKSSTNNDNWVWDRKEEAIKEHFDKVEWSDAILVLNYDKNNIKGYIGGNVLIEMGLALYLGKKIYLLKDIPEISYKEEILGMKPVVLGGDLTKIN
ncbi:MAG: hypothetical protein WC514_00695 [Candidatus Paceibacterota bacterium]